MLEAESVRVDPKIDDRANRLKDSPVLETEETTNVVADRHYKEAISGVGQEDSKLSAFRAKIQTENTAKYAVHSDMLYYLSGKYEEVSF